MNKKKYIICFIALVISVIVYILVTKNLTGFKQYNIKNNIEYFNNNKISSFKIDDRNILDKNNGISIGKNKNELNNGYYDIKIDAKEYIEISINKLFKNFDVNRLYDDKYVDEIVNYIIISTNLNLNKEEFKECILDNYEIVRDLDNSEIIDKVVKNNNISIKIYEENNILKFKIGDKNE